MNKRELIIEYIKAAEENDERNRKIEQGLDLLCDSSGVVMEPMTYRLAKLYDNLLIHVIGQSNFDWIMWYMYESAETGRDVVIDEVRYVIETPERLCDVCIGEIE